MYLKDTSADETKDYVAWDTFYKVNKEVINPIIENLSIEQKAIFITGTPNEIDNLIKQIIINNPTLLMKLNYNSLIQLYKQIL